MFVWVKEDIFILLMSFKCYFINLMIENDGYINFYIDEYYIVGN